jgi:hypothetical protein
VSWIYTLIHGFEISTPIAQRATVPQLLDVFEQHPNIEHSLRPAQGVYTALKMDRPMFAAYHYAFASVDPDAADLFFEQLATGLGVADGDPAYALRTKYVNEKAKPEQIRVSRHVLAAWLVKAWEASRRDQKLTPASLRWVTTGPRAQSFPRVSDVSWLPEMKDGEA